MINPLNIFSIMRIIKNTLFAFAVSMTAIFNLASAQNQQVVFNQNTFEVTYTSDVPMYISFMLFGDESLGIGLIRTGVKCIKPRWHLHRYV